MTARTIAVIDDDRLVRATLKAILEDAGYQVLLAGNAGEAARSIESPDVELIITDIVMPDRNGLDTIRDIRRRRPDVKIIAISGAIPANGESLVAMLGSLGADRVLRKPFKPEQIIGAVEELLQR